MTISTIPHTTHRPLGRRTIAILVATAVFVALLTILMLHSTSSAKPAAPAIPSTGSHPITQTIDGSSCPKVFRGTHAC